MVPQFLERQHTAALVAGAAIDRGAVTTELARHLIDRHFAFDKVIEAASISQIQPRIAS